MDSGKILTGLFVSVSFWAAVVLLLLFSHGEFNDWAIATPITADALDQNNADMNSSVPEKINLSVMKTPSIPFTEIDGEINRGETFTQVMKRLNVADTVRFDIIKGFEKTLDFRELQPGDRFTIRLDRDNSILQAIYTSGPLNTHILARNEEGAYLASRQEIPLEYRIERISGTIESSLYVAFSALGESPKLIHEFADIFASKIDFNTETRSGDSFSLLVEKYYKDDVFVGYGKILVARYQKENIRYEGYHYASENTPSGYFDQNGEALGTWFIRSPIPFGRVTSRFTMRRKHPVDGVIRPHLGVDLAAPLGTPVQATADGRVEYIGRKGGFGKTIVLQHHGGYKTYYGHLNSYKKGLHKGSPVTQKEVIGYVGSTGISTGPHLDYRIQYNGVFRNPFSIKFKPKIVLQDKELDFFHNTKARTADLFNADTGERILQVKNVTLSEKNRITFL